MSVSVLLVDDHRLVREAVRDALARASDIEVVGEAADGSSALDSMRRLAPDVLVLDISLPDLSGIEVANRVRRELGVATKVVMLSIHAERYLVTEAFCAGAVGYVTKTSPMAELTQAIRAAAAGQIYVCFEVARSVSAVEVDSGEHGKASRLTEREQEVLRRIARGMRSPAIADQLRISVGTVEVHRRNIMRKLGLRTVADLTRYALREGLVPL
jgi:DNA-binding NarL/FixJ family response regulator